MTAGYIVIMAASLALLAGLVIYAVPRWLAQIQDGTCRAPRWIAQVQAGARR